MPMTFAMSLLLCVASRLSSSSWITEISCRKVGTTGHGHQRRPDQPIVQPVSLLVFVDDRSLGFARRNVRDGLVQVRVERLPDRLERLQALALEQLSQLPLDEPQTLEPRLTLGFRRGRLERAVVAVEHVEELADQVRLR